MVDMSYIKTRFLPYTNIKNWCEHYASDNNAKVTFELVNHKTHELITLDRLATMLYNAGIPAYRNSYNLRGFDKEKAVFYLTVKGFSVILVCHFVYPAKKDNGYNVDPNGQLRLDI